MIESLGKYRILERIGRGQMGVVYKALDPFLKRTVAIKVIADGLDVTAELRARFFREAQACAKLSHPNIVTVYDLGTEQGHLFIVMEFLDGEDLGQIIAQHRPLSVEDKLALMIQVCDGLSYAHQKGIVHRDVKPANLFVLRDGVVKVMDFGVAKLATAEENLTLMGSVMGTLRYMAPEQVRGRADHRADIFSAAAVCYELLAYHSPLRDHDVLSILEELRSTASPSVFRVDPAIPDDLGAVIERALRKNPDERFASMAEMRAALDVVRARLRDEAQTLRSRLRTQAIDARDLESLLRERIGGGPASASPPRADKNQSVMELERLGQEYDERLSRLREMVERADTLAPRFDWAMEQLRLGEWAAAADTFAEIVAEMPEHARAQEGLQLAHAEVRRRAGEAARRDTEAAELAPPPIIADPRAEAGHVETAAPPADEDAPSPDRRILAEPGPPLAQPTVAGPSVPAKTTEEISAAGVGTGLTATAGRAERPPRSWATVARRIGRRPWAIAAAAFLVIAVAMYWIATSPLTGARRWRPQIEDAQTRVNSARDRAMKAESSLLARALFDGAVADAGRANQLVGARRFAEAVEALQGAAARYDDAARAAAVALMARARADDARVRMREAKARAVAGTGQFEEALTQEREADRRYQDLAFDEAADRFRAAGELFSKNPPAPPEQAEQSPAERGAADTEAAIREVLRSYARAFETKDLGLLQGIRPGIRPDDLSRHRDVFDHTRSYRLNLKIDRISVNGDTAEARGRREDIVVSRNGETFQTAGPFAFRLKRIDTRWTIDAVK